MDLKDIDNDKDFARYARFLNISVGNTIFSK